MTKNPAHQSSHHLLHAIHISSISPRGKKEKNNKPQQNPKTTQNKSRIVSKCSSGTAQLGIKKAK